MVLGFLASGAVAIGVAALIYNFPGDTEGAAVIAGLVVLAVGVRTVVRWMLEHTEDPD
jgi:hypothetical protein